MSINFEAMAQVILALLIAIGFLLMVVAWANSDSDEYIRQQKSLKTPFFAGAFIMCASIVLTIGIAT